MDGNFLVTSYYRDGTTVHDITFPENMVAYYDSYSGKEKDLMDVGELSILPSGNIISSDRNSVEGGFSSAKIINISKRF